MYPNRAPLRGLDGCVGGQSLCKGIGYSLAASEGVSLKRLSTKKLLGLTDASLILRLRPSG